MIAAVFVGLDQILQTLAKLNRIPFEKRVMFFYIGLKDCFELFVCILFFVS